MKKIVPIVIVAIALTIGGALLIKKKKEELNKLNPPKIYPEVVKTIKPKETDFMLTLTSLGVIKSGANVVISTKVAARILSIKPLGSLVKKGEIIVKLDSNSTRSKILSTKTELKSLYSKLRAAKLSLKNLILSHERTKELMNVNGASIEQYQKEADTISNMRANISSIESHIKNMKTTLRELNTLLGYTIIKSPINGIISKKFQNIGDMAMPGKPICEVSTRENKYILIDLPSNIKPKGIIFHGKFYKVFPLNSTFNGLNQYKADISTNLNSGSRVEVGVVVFKGKAIKLPFDAVLSDNGANYVFELTNQRAIPIKVHIIAHGEEGLAINNQRIIDKNIIVAKPDIFIKLLGGVKVVKEQ